MGDGRSRRGVSGYRISPGRSRGGGQLCARVARKRTATSGLWPCLSGPWLFIPIIAACSVPMGAPSPSRKLPAGARRARARPHARPTRLAHPLGPGRRARPDGAARGGAALRGTALRIAPDEPSVLSNLGLLLRALQGPDPGRNDAPAGGRPVARRSAGAAKPRAGRRLCKADSPRRRRSRGPTCRRMKRPPTSPICGRCWRSRTAGNSRARPPCPFSGPREADRSPRYGASERLWGVASKAPVRSMRRPSWTQADQQAWAPAPRARGRWRQTRKR